MIRNTVNKIRNPISILALKSSNFKSSIIISLSIIQPSSRSGD